MQNKLKKVLSILAVFVVLVGSLLVPVHAESTAEESESLPKVKTKLADDEIANPKSAKKLEVMIEGIQEGDKVYAVRMLDAIYTKGNEHSVKRFENKEWLGKDNGFDLTKQEIKIDKTKFINIISIFKAKYKDENALITEVNKEPEVDSENDVLFLGEAESDSLKASLLPGLYFIHVVPGEKTKRIYNPGVLGVNPESVRDEAYEGAKLNMGEGQNFMCDGKALYLKSEPIDAQFGKYISPQSSDDTKVYSPVIDELLGFKIYGIHLPEFELKYENTGVIIEDSFPSGAFAINEKSLKIRQNYKDSVVKMNQIYAGSEGTSNIAPEDKDAKIEELLKKNNGESVDYFFVEKDGKYEGFVMIISPLLLQTNDYVKPGVTIGIKYATNFKGGKEFEKDNQTELMEYENKIKVQKYKIEENEGKQIEIKYDENPLENSTNCYTFAPTVWKYDGDELKAEEVTNVKNEDLSRYGLGDAEFLLEKVHINSYGYKEKRSTSSNPDTRGLVKFRDFPVKLVSQGFIPDDKFIKSFINSYEKGNMNLKETEAPNLYNKLDGKKNAIVLVELKEDGKTAQSIKVLTCDNNKADEIIVALEMGVDDIAESYVKGSIAQIPNTRQFKFPTTGSNTMMILTVVGIVLVTGAVAISRKKKHQNSLN